MDLKEALKDKLTKREMKFLVTSFDVVGEVAILEIPKELKKKEKKIADAVLEIQKNVKTVVKKASEREGEFRLKKYKILKGKSTETIHRESGCQYKVDIRKSYFSGRESTERLRILQQVRDGERVLVMFAGVGPYGILIGKKHKNMIVWCVESNKQACKYAEENIFINKVQDRVKALCEDVKKISAGKFDRILMPLPESAVDFLDVAFSHSKQNTTIHLYGIADQKKKEEIDFSKLLKRIEEEATKAGKKVKVLEKHKVLPYAPRKYKVCIDFQVL